MTPSTAVKNIPVNYATRFSGPVTTLTARRVGDGVEARLVCQPDSLPSMFSPIGGLRAIAGGSHPSPPKFVW
jgi:hypothetical protein